MNSVSKHALIVAAEEQIIDAAKKYVTILYKANELVSQFTDDLLSGSPARFT